MMTPKYIVGEVRRPDTFQDLTDKRFGRLVAVRVVFPPGRMTSPRWVCLCDCGQASVVNGQSLRDGRTNSCGCLGIERRQTATTIHGHGSRSSRRRGTAYNSWYAMKQRCGNPKSTGFPGYGGRGITYDPRWAEFKAFLADMGERPPSAQLDRIDNNGNYEKSNCRWLSPQDNCNNTNSNRRVTFEGRSLTVAELARESGIHYRTLHSRIDRGWTVEESVGPLCSSRWGLGAPQVHPMGVGTATQPVGK